MERVTISIPDDFAAELAEFMSNNHYENRSEAVRDLARLGLEQSRIDRGVAGPCIATLSYIYDHNTRELPKRLTDARHAQRCTSIGFPTVASRSPPCAATHARFGTSQKTVIAERGVMHGQVTFVVITMHEETHDHAGGPPQRHQVHSP
jgi:CopG family nickel-responsive transcriptional regulator